MKTEKTIEILNELIVINNDRIEGYDTASGETDDPGLKSLFSALQTTSQTNLIELRDAINSLSGEIEEGTRTTGKFFRVWMDVKAALMGNDRATILDSCEFGEDKALETYRNALKSDVDFNPTYLNLIRKQENALRADHDKVKALRDAAAK